LGSERRKNNNFPSGERLKKPLSAQVSDFWECNVENSEFGVWLSPDEWPIDLQGEDPSA